MTCDWMTITPEEAGVSSRNVSAWIQMLDDYHMHVHSFLLARGDRIFAEGYYRPFREDTQHRMYSVSKSFVAVAVGLAATEGLFSLDDAILPFFPEYRPTHTDAEYERCTVRDMLSMRSNICTNVPWWGRFRSRVEAYYSQRTGKLCGGLFTYDSIGSFLLGCIIEKLTGTDLLSYMKDRVLRRIGFSEESFLLKEPGGFGVGDSGIVCTTRDLFLLARLVMKRGAWDGVQYIDRAYMEQAVQCQVPNSPIGDFRLFNTSGYGYLMWKTHASGCAFIGLGDQLAIMDFERDVTLILTADNQPDRTLRHLILHEYLYHFLPHVQRDARPADPQAHGELTARLRSLRLIAQSGTAHSPLEPQVYGRYKRRTGEGNISAFTLTEDTLTLTYRGESYALPFGRLENRHARFSFGMRAKADQMGIYERGTYDTQVSAAWVSDSIFALLAQVTDTYFGSLSIQIAFIGHAASVSIMGAGQYVFDGIQERFIAEKETDV